jgi:hypothetical protein
MIPHTSVPSGYGLGSLFGGYVVPAGRLILVDRRPYHREWTAPGRGTDKGSDESFHCQTNDGLNVDVEISISTYVTEDNAAKFLYFFGVKSDPNEDRSDPNNIFRSVYHGYSLTEVMDGVARGNVHNSVCDEMSKYALADANKHMYDIMQDIRKNTATYLIQKGITLDYIGWAGTWAFDPSIQAAVNRNFESTQDQAVAKALAPYADTLMNLAFVEATREISQKWNGALPTTLSGLWLFPSSLLDGVKKIASAILPQEPVMHKGPVTNDDYH